MMSMAWYVAPTVLLDLIAREALGHSTLGPALRRAEFRQLTHTTWNFFWDWAVEGSTPLSLIFTPPATAVPQLTA